MSENRATAASFVPSLLEAIPLQYCGSTDLFVHDSPESEDVQISPSTGSVKPSLETAASFIPSLLDAIALQ